MSNSTTEQVLSKIRSSKFKHVFGRPSRKDACYENVHVTTGAYDGNFCAVNPRFVAVVVEAVGGGAFIILPLKKVGRVEMTVPRVCGHAGPVTDLKWSPFDDQVIASCSDDMTVKVWEIPERGLTGHMTECAADLRGHTRRVAFVEWHPTAEHVLLSAGFDYKCIIWNTYTADSLRVICCHENAIHSIAWNRDGSLFATTCKDRKIRVIDPRLGHVVQEGQGHEGLKPSKILFITESNYLLSTGFSKMGDREFAIWSAHDLSRPLNRETIDYSSGVLLPFYDHDTRMVYLAGKGDGNIRYYEVSSEPPYTHYLCQYPSADPQRGLGWMPKRGLDLRQCEIARFYKLHTSKQLIEPLAMIVPRKSDEFQEDIYPPTAAPIPALSARKWLSGVNRDPTLLCLKPLYDSAALDDDEDFSVRLTTRSLTNSATSSRRSSLSIKNRTLPPQVAPVLPTSAPASLKNILKLSTDQDCVMASPPTANPVDEFERRLAEVRVQTPRVLHLPRPAPVIVTPAVGAVKSQDERPVSSCTSVSAAEGPHGAKSNATSGVVSRPGLVAAVSVPPAVSRRSGNFVPHARAPSSSSTSPSSLSPEHSPPPYDRPTVWYENAAWKQPAFPANRSPVMTFCRDVEATNASLQQLTPQFKTASSLESTASCSISMQPQSVVRNNVAQEPAIKIPFQEAQRIPEVSSKCPAPLEESSTQYRMPVGNNRVATNSAIQATAVVLPTSRHLELAVLGSRQQNHLFPQSTQAAVESRPYNCPPGSTVHRLDDESFVVLHRPSRDSSLNSSLLSCPVRNGDDLEHSSGEQHCSGASEWQSEVERKKSVKRMKQTIRRSQSAGRIEGRRSPSPEYAIVPRSNVAAAGRRQSSFGDARGQSSCDDDDDKGKMHKKLEALRKLRDEAKAYASVPLLATPSGSSLSSSSTRRSPAPSLPVVMESSLGGVTEQATSHTRVELTQYQCAIALEHQRSRVPAACTSIQEPIDRPPTSPTRRRSANLLSSSSSRESSKSPASLRSSMGDCTAVNAEAKAAIRSQPAVAGLASSQQVESQMSALQPSILVGANATAMAEPQSRSSRSSSTEQLASARPAAAVVMETASTTRSSVGRVHLVGGSAGPYYNAREMIHAGRQPRLDVHRRAYSFDEGGEQTTKAVQVQSIAESLTDAGSLAVGFSGLTGLKEVKEPVAVGRLLRPQSSLPAELISGPPSGQKVISHGQLVTRHTVPELLTPAAPPRENNSSILSNAELHKAYFQQVDEIKSLRQQLAAKSKRIQQLEANVERLLTASNDAK